MIWISLNKTAIGDPLPRIGSSEDRSPVVRDFLSHANQHPDGSAAYTIDVSAWSADIRHLPIGVFDSGIGGLTVLEAARYQGPAVGHSVAPLDVAALNIYGFDMSGVIGDAAKPESLRLNSVRSPSKTPSVCQCEFPCFRHRA